MRIEPAGLLDAAQVVDDFVVLRKYADYEVPAWDRSLRWRACEPSTSDEPVTRAAVILVVDDEPAMRELLVGVLERDGFVASEAGNAEEARTRMLSNPPDLMLLDWMLPGQSGYDFSRELRREARTRRLPIIMLTARGEEPDKVHGLEAGADDYVTKPFSVNELMARIKSVLRRTSLAASPDALEIDGLRLDPGSHRVTAHSHPLELGPTEFRLLHFFMTNPELVHSRSKVIDLVWGTSVYVEERTVDVHVRRLRKVLEPSGHDRLIQTVRGAGYRLSVETQGAAT